VVLDFVEAQDRLASSARGVCLAETFPRRVLKRDNGQQSLAQLSLLPNATLMVDVDED
jgi:hypothetical protein